MKVDIKELEKAISFFKKNGDPAEVTVDFDTLGHFRMRAYTDLSGQVTVTLYESDSRKMAEVTKTERL